MALQPSVMNKSIYLGITHSHRTDLALKIGSSTVFSPIHCLTSLNSVAEL